MSGDDVPVGKPFSQVYLRPTAPLKDSDSFRNRLAAYVLNKDRSGIDIGGLAEYLRINLGANELHSHGTSYAQVRDLIRETDIANVLNAITWMYRYLCLASRQHGFGAPTARHVEQFRRFVSRLFEEEFLGYSLDEKCGVRRNVDTDFEQIRIATVAYLGHARYKAVLAEFEAAYRALEAPAPDTKVAVRSMFEAVEALFRLLCPKAKLLSSSEVKKHLMPMIDALYTGEPLAANTVKQLVNGLSDWTDGLHAYRHGQPEPSPPPMEAAVAILQTGSAYIRLLIELDRKVQGG